MSNINIVIGSKGGIGKSLIAAMLGQYIIEKKGAILGFDTDFHNTTFAHYKGLGVKPLRLYDPETKEVLTVGLDLILEASADNPDVDIVIDIGASSFLAVFQYMLDMDLASIWTDMGHKTNFHTLIGGGGNYLDTLATFTELMEHGVKSKGARCIAWLNSYHGPIESNGIPFENSEAYQKYEKKVAAIVPVPRFNTLFTGMLEKICADRLLLSEVKESSKYNIAEKARVPKLKNDWWEAMSLADKFIL